MVKVVKGNIFDSQAQTLVNTINCVGVMGKGLALEFKNRYPAMFDKYKSFCDKGVFKPGVLWIFKADDGKWILNFPTKVDWRNPSKIEYIEEGLKKFVEIWKEKGIISVAFPLLGCKNGGLDPEEVIPLMKKYLEKCEGLSVMIYDDRDPVDDKNYSNDAVKKINDQLAEKLDEFKDANPKEVIKEAEPLVDEEPAKSTVDIEEAAIKQSEEVEVVKVIDSEVESVNTEGTLKPDGNFELKDELKEQREKYSEEQEILKEIVAERKAINHEVDKILNDFVGQENTPEVRKAVTKKLYNVINRRGFPAGSIFQI